MASLIRSVASAASAASLLPVWFLRSCWARSLRSLSRVSCASRLRQLGAQIVEAGAIAGDAGLVDGGIDLGEQIALLHQVADVRIDGAELAGDLGADIDIGLGLHVGDGGDAGLDIAEFHRRGLEGGRDGPRSARW